MRTLRFFFLSPSLGADFLAVFLAALSAVVLAGALEAVDTGAFPAVEAGLGAIAEVKTWKGNSEDSGGREEEYEVERTLLAHTFIHSNVCVCLAKTRDVARRASRVVQTLIIWHSHSPYITLSPTPD